MGGWMGGGVRTHLGGGLGPNHLGDGGEIFTVAPDGWKATAGQNMNHFALERPCSCPGATPFIAFAPSLLTLHRQELLVCGPARVHLGGRLRGTEHIWSHLQGERGAAGEGGGRLTSTGLAPSTPSVKLCFNMLLFCLMD